MNHGNQSGEDERGQAQRTATESEADRWSRETGYQPSGNQVREEPVPASHDEERGQEAEVRNEEHSADNLEAGPSRRARSE
jgi:hypothetical protein